jgi:hypothetical protein
MQKQDPCRGILHRSGASRVTFQVALAVIAAMSVTPASAEWLFDASANVAYDDNLTRAASPADVRSAASASVAAAAGMFLAPTAYDSVTLGVDAGGEAFGRYHGLDNGWAGATAVYRHKAALGYDAPWIALAASATYFDYDADLRTGPRFVIRAELGKRFGETLDAHAAWFRDRRLSPHGGPEMGGLSGDVFDLRGQGGDIGIAYAATEVLLLSANLIARRGDVVSTASRSWVIYTASSAVAADPAFGDELYAYRLRGTTYTLALAGSWALDSRSSFSAGYAAERTHAPNGLDYRSDRIAVTLQYRY